MKQTPGQKAAQKESLQVCRAIHQLGGSASAEAIAAHLDWSPDRVRRRLVTCSCGHPTVTFRLFRCVKVIGQKRGLWFLSDEGRRLLSEGK